MQVSKTTVFDEKSVSFIFYHNNILNTLSQWPADRKGRVSLYPSGRDTAVVCTRMVAAACQAVVYCTRGRFGPALKLAICLRGA